MKTKQRVLAALLSGAMLLTGSGCAIKGLPSGPGGKKEPVEISVWYYYSGTQKTAFDQLTQEFNDTVGREQGITVTGYNYGDVNQLEESVIAAINKEVGSTKVPNIFASYADTAYQVEQMGILAELDQYFTPEEQAEYIESYIEEGRIGAENTLKIFPIAKSTEVFMMNKTDWEVFAQATGSTLDELATMEGVVQVAKRYYEWTDAKTPDVADDGLAFYGRDAIANFFIIASMQMGREIFQVQNGKVTLTVDKETMRRIWDVYYLPHMQGYFAENGKFRSEEVRIGQLLALTGSCSAASYFPTEVLQGDASYPIESLILPPPMLEGAKPYAVQQGAGMVVTKATPREEEASVAFLKWFTDVSQNLKFCGNSGYMPVKKAANSTELLNKMLDQSKDKPNIAAQQTLQVAFKMTNEMPLYTNKAFEKGRDARKVLTDHLSGQMHADLDKVAQAMASGASRAEAIAPYVTDEAFEAWFASFNKALEQAVA